VAAEREPVGVGEQNPTATGHLQVIEREDEAHG